MSSEVELTQIVAIELARNWSPFWSKTVHSEQFRLGLGCVRPKYGEEGLELACWNVVIALTVRYGMMPAMLNCRHRTDSNATMWGPKSVVFWAFMAAALAVGVGMYWSISQRTAPSNSASAYVPAEPATYNHLKVSILGDSYAVGIGAPQGAGYQDILTTSLCWVTNLSGQSGTGFGNPGAEDRDVGPFPTRTAAVASTKPELILVQGGMEDVRRSDVRAEADATFTQLKSEAPDARIVVVGPTAPPAANHDEISAVRDAIKAAANAANVTFIDPIEEGWLANPALYGIEGLHPTAAGHKEFAASIRAQLEGLSLPRLQTCDPV